MSATAMEILCQFRERLSGRIGQNRYQTWFGDAADFQFHDDHLEVVVTNDFVGSWITSNHLGDLVAVARETIGPEVHVDIRVQKGERPHNGAAATPRLLPGRSQSRPALRGELDSLVVGPSNSLAVAAARQIIAGDVSRCRLLVIHGGCGLGKTHLLQGLVNAARRSSISLDCRYLSGEEFTNEYILALRTNRHEVFRSKYRTADLLVVDDVHFFANKRATQEEFLHTFNAIDAAGKTVALSSDRHPRQIETLSEALRSRLISGMVVEVHPPDLTMRREILQRRAAQMSCTIPGDVLDFVATHIVRNVRELEGALYRLAAMVSLTKEPLTVELARLILDDQIARSRPAPQPAEIEQAVCHYFSLEANKLRSRSRDRLVSLARSVAMFLVRKHTSLSFPEIARALGGRNHSTVIMAVRRIERLIELDQSLDWRNAGGEQTREARAVITELERQIVRPA